MKKEKRICGVKLLPSVLAQVKKQVGLCGFHGIEISAAEWIEEAIREKIEKGSQEITL